MPYHKYPSTVGSQPDSRPCKPPPRPSSRYINCNPLTRFAPLYCSGLVWSRVFTTSKGITREWVKAQPKAPDRANKPWQQCSAGTTIKKIWKEVNQDSVTPLISEHIFKVSARWCKTLSTDVGPLSSETISNVLCWPLLTVRGGMDAIHKLSLWGMGLQQRTIVSRI